jgi:cell wall-associated NlpC family hydrolase
MCNASGLPWLIVGVLKDGDDLSLTEITEQVPDDYEAPLVGRSFVHGVLDCYSLIKDYYKRELGIELPHFERRDNWWNLGENLYMEKFTEAGFATFKGPIQKHDVVIMQVYNSPVPNHAGVYIGNDQILHHMYNRLSTRDVYGGGYFQEVTRVVVRYKELMQ